MRPRNTHGYKERVPFPQQAALSRKTQWCCHILHTVYFFWGIESHSPWETKVGKKQTNGVLGYILVTVRWRNIQPVKVNTNTTTSPCPKGEKKKYNEENYALHNNTSKLMNQCSNIVAVNYEHYLIAHGFAVLSVANGDTHQPAISRGSREWAWR